MLLTLASFLFVLGVLVFVHELGHFLAAKRVGIRVLKFQLGFNPTIFSFRYGDTEYGIGALPLGGYVKMAGESPDDATTGGKPDEFLSKSKWERFQVLIMGPAMNLILAVVAMAVVLYNGAEVFAFLDRPPVVGSVSPGSSADLAGIARNDLIVSVNDREVPTWRDVYVQVELNREVTFKVRRSGVDTVREVVAPPADKSESKVEAIGLLPDTHPFLKSVNAGEPGDKAGLKAGDIVLAIDGKTTTFQDELRKAIASHPETTMSVRVLRDGVEQALAVTPGKKGDGDGWLGVLPSDEMSLIKPGLWQAIAMSAEQNVKTAGLIFQTLWGLITRDTSPKQLMGPIGIAQLSGEYAQLGWSALLGLMASISLNLGLLNLLPIPVLDGGHIMIMAMEGISRRDFSSRAKERMVLTGLVVLMMLMVTVIYNDLTKIEMIKHLMPWR